MVGLLIPKQPQRFATPRLTKDQSSQKLRPTRSQPYLNASAQEFLRPSTLLAALLISTSVWTGQSASTWPQFRGPGGMADAGEQEIPNEFGPEQNVLWHTELPSGHSSPCIWEDRVFLSGYQDQKLVMLALDRGNGKILWERSVSLSEDPAYIHRSVLPTLSTPCADGKRVYFYFPNYGLVTLEHDGSEAWKRELPSPRSGLGTGTSPILVGDSLILNRDGSEDPCILALEATTGEVRWKHPRFGYNNSQSTPFLWENRFRSELVVAGSNALVSLDPKTGTLIWKVEDTCSLPCPTPTGNKDMLFFPSWTTTHLGGRDKLEAHFEDDLGLTDAEATDPEAFFARFDRDGDQRLHRDEVPQSRAKDVFKWVDKNRNDHWELQEFSILLKPAGKGRNIMVAVNAGGEDLLNGTPYLAWERNKHLPYVASPLLSDNRVYLVKSLGIISCLDGKTGEPFFEGERLGVKGEYFASPIKVGSKILVTSNLGSVIVLRDSEKLEILSRHDFGEEIVATPAIVENTLYLRTASGLWAFAKR